MEGKQFQEQYNPFPDSSIIDQNYIIENYIRMFLSKKKFDQVSVDWVVETYYRDHRLSNFVSYFDNFDQVSVDQVAENCSLSCVEEIIYCRILSLIQSKETLEHR